MSKGLQIIEDYYQQCGVNRVSHSPSVDSVADNDYDDNDYYERNELNVSDDRVNDGDIVEEDIKDFCYIEPGRMFAIVGITGTGKTHFLRELVYQNCKRFNNIIVISPSADSLNKNFNRKNYDFISNKHIIASPSVDKIKSIIEDQKKARVGLYYPELLLICDDLIGTIDTHNSKEFDKLYCTGRQYGVTTCILTQYYKSLGPVIRNNLGCLFITKIRNNCLEELYKNQNVITKRKRFITYMNKLCKDFNIIRFNMVGYDSDNIYISKVEDNRKFWIE